MAKATFPRITCFIHINTFRKINSIVFLHIFIFCMNNGLMKIVDKVYYLFQLMT